jgi:hypothetical protein
MYHLTKKSGKFDELSKQVLDNLPDDHYTIEKKKRKATNPQKKYFFGVVFAKISKYLEAHGKYHSPEDLYESYKAKGYFGYCEILDEPVPQGLSKASTMQTSAAKERLQAEWAERGLIIPDPQQTEFLDAKDNL